MRLKFLIDDLKVLVEMIENDLWGNNMGIYIYLELIFKWN